MKLRAFIAKVDSLILNGQIQRWYSSATIRKLQGSVGVDLGYKIVTHYKKDANNELARLCDLYGSDKGEIRTEGHPYEWQSHTYTDYYSRLLGASRQTILKVFECGLGTNNPRIPSAMGIQGKPGASLRVWRDYFPNAVVWGGDIDRDVLFQEERIKTRFINQMDTDSIRTFWGEIGVQDFDFMVDDGLHTFEAGSNLFLNSIEYLAASGVYVIEDVLSLDLLRYKEFFKASEYLVDYVVMSGPNLDFVDNNLVVVRKPS